MARCFTSRHEPACGPGGAVRRFACVGGRQVSSASGRRRLAGARFPRSVVAVRHERWMRRSRVGCAPPGRFPGAEPVRRCVRIWSITMDCVRNATIRIEPAHCGHTSGSTSKISCSNAAHRRVASVGGSRGTGSKGARTKLPTAGHTSGAAEMTRNCSTRWQLHYLELKRKIVTFKS